jgi:hypothetical protein
MQARVRLHSPVATLACLTIAGIAIYIAVDVIVQPLTPHYCAMSRRRAN